MVSKGEGAESGIDGEFGVGRFNLLHLGWIAMGSCCTAQGTITSLLGYTMMEGNIRKGMCVYMCVCVCVTLLYSRNWHNLVNQL